MLAPHGTTRRYHQHRTLGEDPCTPCVQEFRADGRRRTAVSRIRTGKDKAMRIPLDVLAAVLAGETDALVEHLGPEVADAITERVVVTRRRAA